jgi:signal peptidase II
LSLHESIPIIPGFLWITRIHNSGIAFGFFPGLPRLFMAVTILSMLIVLYFYLTIQPRTMLTILGCAFILGGAAGNLIDRVHYGHVVDFINFSFWPAFNLADSSVSIGVAFLLASFLFEKKELKEHASNLV